MTTLDLMVWCADRQSFIDGMTAYGFATLAEDGSLVPRRDVLIDEIGPITKTPATYDDAGVELTPAVIVEGHHVNIRVVGEFAAQVTAGRPETGTVFERTSVLNMIPGLTWEPITEEGVPPGYVGLHGVRLYDPATVNLPFRRWA